MATPLGDARTSPQPTEQHQTTGLGQLLKSARERKGLTLEQVARETRIPRSHLEALEHDNLSAAPGGFYRRAEIRTYARAVNLDPNLAIAQLEHKLEIAAQRPAKPPPSADQTRSPARHRLLMIFGALAAATVIGLTIGGRVPGFRQPDQASARPDSGSPNTPPPIDAKPSDDGVGIADRAAADRVFPEDHPSVDTPVVDTPAVDGPAVEPASSEVDLAPPPAAAPALAVATEPAPAAIPVARPDAVAPATPTPPVPAIAVPGIVVATEPPGARVTVNGIGWGTTPVTIRYLPAGEKRIRVSKEGYAAEERTVNVTEGRRITIDIRLQAAP
jgi:cytoskeletal protein RodZ